MLATLPGVQVLPLGSGEAAEVATTVHLVKGDLVRAHAVWAALEYDADYLTSEPHLTPSVIAPNWSTTSRLTTPDLVGQSNPLKARSCNDANNASNSAKPDRCLFLCSSTAMTRSPNSF